MLLTTVFAAIGGLLTALHLLDGMSLWWVLPAWLGYSVSAALLYILVVVFGLYFFLPKEDPSPKRRHFTHTIMKLTLQWVLVILGIKVTVEGADKLPHTPYLLVGNHRSAFDPITTIAALDTPIVFVAKPSVLSIPIIGTILERLCFLGIDRENARNAVTTIKRAAELIKDVDLSVGIYPEGTRSRDGSLLPLHAGSFKIAKLAACPVAVVTVRYEKSGLLPWNKQVHLQVVDVMEEAFVADSGTAPMAERTETAIRTNLGL